MKFIFILFTSTIFNLFLKCEKVCKNPLLSLNNVTLNDTIISRSPIFSTKYCKNLINQYSCCTQNHLSEFPIEIQNIFAELTKKNIQDDLSILNNKKNLMIIIKDLIYLENLMKEFIQYLFEQKLLKKLKNNTIVMIFPLVIISNYSKIFN